MGLLSRLRQWSDLQKVGPTEELPDVAGGRDGELLLAQLIGSSYQFKDAHLLTGRRIPTMRQGRRREIDLIVCTPRMIHLIEVKNWSGRLDVRNGNWHQTRRDGDVVEHGDLLESNQLKVEAVVEYLRHQGLSPDLDDQRLRGLLAPRIIFTNPNLQLAPALEARPDVVSRRELDEFLGKQPRKNRSAETMFSSLIELCLARESRPGQGAARASATSGPIPPGQYKQIVAWLGDAATWDRLQFYGGRTIAGDVINLRVGGTTYRSAELRELAGRHPIRLRWTRGRSWGLFKAVTGLGSLGSLRLGKTRLALTTADTVLVHTVGEPTAAGRKLIELEQIDLGS